MLSTEAGVWGGEHARRRSSDLQVSILLEPSTGPAAVLEPATCLRVICSSQQSLKDATEVSSEKCAVVWQVPDNLGRLTNLRTLLIGLKTVKAIPEPILQLTGLESLAITFCKLQRLPASVAAMRNLRTLCLQGNPGLAVSAPFFPTAQSVCRSVTQSLSQSVCQ